MDRVTRLFAAGTGIVALRVADDSFFQPPAYERRVIGFLERSVGP